MKFRIGVAVALFLAVGPVQATTIHVPADPTASVPGRG